MTATVPGHGVGASVLDFGFVRGAGLDGAEDAFARGVEHALRLAGYDVQDGSLGAGQAESAELDGRGAIVVAASLADAPALLERVKVPAVLVPIVRGEDARCWLEVARRARSTWTGSPGFAQALRAGGAVAHCIGIACQFGRVRHHARAAYRVRDEDFVFGMHPTTAVETSELDVLRTAVREFFAASATRFAKATVLVSAARDADLLPWRELADELRCDALVTAIRPSSGLAFAGFAALADCEIVAGAAPGTVPWSAAAGLFAARPALVLGGLEPRPFGQDEPPHLQRIGADPDALVLAMARLVNGDGDRAVSIRGARQMIATNSARAVTVAIVEALQADGLWHAEGGR